MLALITGTLSCVQVDTGIQLGGHSTPLPLVRLGDAGLAQDLDEVPRELLGGHRCATWAAQRSASSQPIGEIVLTAAT